MVRRLLMEVICTEFLTSVKLVIRYSANTFALLLFCIPSRVSNYETPAHTRRHWFLIWKMQVVDGVVIQVIVEVLRGDHKEKIPVILEPKPDESWCVTHSARIYTFHVPGMQYIFFPTVHICTMGLAGAHPSTFSYWTWCNLSV